MKKTLGIFLCSLCFSALQAQYTIPDANFAAKLQVIVPNAMNGNVLDENHPDVTSLLNMSVLSSNIADLDGIQHFTGLESLDCEGNILVSLPPLPSTLVVLKCGYNEFTSLPALPNSLTTLWCRFNQLTNLPPLPNSLTQLRCDDNQLTGLPVLPNSLTYLRCNDNQLTSLPALPNSLTTIYCSQNPLTGLPILPISLVIIVCASGQLTALPALPSSLVSLNCENNQLTSLPNLPNSLAYLYCSLNQLSSLPALPNSLTYISCVFNQLTSLPALPNSLTSLDCHENPITFLPTLPSALESLYCYDNSLFALPELPNTLEHLDCRDNMLSCLPPLPNGLYELYSFGNAINCLPNVPAALSTSVFFTSNNLGFTPVLCDPIDPCFPSQAVTGNMFNDANGNGLQDVGETAFLTGVAEAQPGNYLGGVDVNGSYGIPVIPGSYTVQGQPVLYHTISTPAHNVTIAPGMSDTANHIGYQPIPGVYDLVSDISTQAARPGFDNILWLQVENVGTETTVANIDLAFDSDQTWVSSSITPDTQVGNSATWSPILDPGDSWNTMITLNTSVIVPLGTAIDHTLSALPQQPDEAPANNIATVSTFVVGSYDPNDKLLAPASMLPNEILAGAPIEYTIRFQNTGTFMAETVRITDTLSGDLEWNTFEMVASSHSNFWWISEGVLVIVHNNINLPDSTSDEPNSHGFVKFRMQPSNQLLPGTTIENVANIYFDFNEPVITEPAVFEVETSIVVNENDADAFFLWPNPATGTLWLSLADPTPSNVEVLDITGKVLVSAASNGGNEQELDILRLRSGVYFVRLTNAEGVRTARFVKY